MGIPDVLILNAGISERFNVRNFDLHTIQRQFDVNFFGVLYFLNLFLPDFIERRRGIIAATSSLAGYRGMPEAAPYAASKSALSVFMESLRIDLWNVSIQVTTISPGFVESAMTDQNEFYMPFMLSADKAARRIIRGLEAGKAEIHFPYRLSLVAKGSRLLPHKLYAWLMQRARQS
jgi:short-subunit dehydrogenase